MPEWSDSRNLDRNDARDPADDPEHTPSSTRTAPYKNSALTVARQAANLDQGKNLDGTDPAHTAQATDGTPHKNSALTVARQTVNLDQGKNLDGTDPAHTTETTDSSFHETSASTAAQQETDAAILAAAEIPTSRTERPGRDGGSAQDREAANSFESDLIKAKIDNHKEHLTYRDLDAARRELTGEIVQTKPDGVAWDHIGEVQDSQEGLDNQIERINRRLGWPDLPPDERATLEKYLGEASRLLDHSEQFVPRRD
jgi:Bacterial toxin 28